MPQNIQYPVKDKYMKNNFSNVLLLHILLKIYIFHKDNKQILYVIIDNKNVTWNI